MKTKNEQKNMNLNEIVDVGDNCATIEEDGLNVMQATAMTVVTIIAVTLGTIYGSIL